MRAHWTTNLKLHFLHRPRLRWVLCNYMLCNMYVHTDTAGMNFSLYSLLAGITGLFWWRTGYEEKDIFLRMSLVFWFVGTW
jgi:hypothetical protein